MTWVKIEDGFADHPKLLRAGPIAGWLHLAGLCYSARHLTDGHVPVQAIHTLAVFNGVAATGDGQLFSEPMRVDVHELARILVRAGLWEEQHDGETKVLTGWLIHDYLAYNPSRAQATSARYGSRAGGVVRAHRAKRSKTGQFLPATQVPLEEGLAPPSRPVPKVRPPRKETVS
jgi:hypothetical protein